MESTDGPGARSAPGRTALSLDKSRELVELPRFDELRSGWRVLLYPAAFEATITFVAQHAARGRHAVPEDWDAEATVDAETGEILEATDEDSWARTNGQAASRSRRYFVANRLRYMWVLTHDPKQVSEWERFDRARAMRETGKFARRVRVQLGKSFPYWYSPELHPGGNGWHVNFFVAAWLPHGIMQELWGFGIAWVTDFERSPRAPHGEPLGLCRTPQEGWRRAASYGCKYAQKDWSREHVGARAHRYEVGQNFSPKAIRRWANSKREAEDLVRASLPVGATSSLEVWDSNDSEHWNRPPTKVFRW